MALPTTLAPEPSGTALPASPAMPTDAELDKMFETTVGGIEPSAEEAPAAPAAPAVVEPVKVEEQPPAEPSAGKLEPQQPLVEKSEPAAKPAPTLEPEPEPTAEDVRQAILAANEEVRRQARDFTKKYGRTVLDPAEIEAENEGQNALKQFQEEFPDLYKGIRHMLRGYVPKDEFADYAASLKADVEEGRTTIEDARAELRVAVVVPDLAAVIEHPDPINEWIETLPYLDARKVIDALEHSNDPAEVSVVIERFKKEKGLARYADALRPGQGSTGAASGATPAAPANPAAPPVTRLAPVNQERLAAAGAVPGEGTAVPAGQRPAGLPDEKALDAAFERLAK